MPLTDSAIRNAKPKDKPYKPETRKRRFPLDRQSTDWRDRSTRAAYCSKTH
jgi:hypothetical protein